MKKLTLILATVIGATSLVACGKESDFKKAINAKISQSPECLSVPSGDTGGYMDLNESEVKALKDKTKGAYIVSQSFDKNSKEDMLSDYAKKDLAQFDALANAGLLTKSTEKLSTINWMDKQPNGGYRLFTIYTLTDAGKNTAAKVEVSGMAKSLFGDNGNRVFCYATPEVVKIENYTEGSYGGMDVVRVKYSYKYTNVADWANNADVKAAFPDISRNLDNPDKTNDNDLIKTKNGWSTDLD